MIKHPYSYCGDCGHTAPHHHSDCPHRRGLPVAPVLRLLPLEEDPNPLGTMYRKVRDATMCSEGCSNAEKVAVLELVKAEIVRSLQSQIDEE